MKIIFFRNSIILRKKYLIVSDLHVGIEKDMNKKGINANIHASVIEKRIKEIANTFNVNVIVINGDIKHDILKKDKHVEKFIENLRKDFEVIIVKGNHDAGTKGLKKEFLVDNVCITHGHRWPSPLSINCKLWICGHEHPVIRAGNYYEKVWVVGRLEKNVIKKVYGKESTIKVIFMPAFSPLIFGYPISYNITGRGPIMRAIQKKSVDVFSEKFLYLGKLNYITKETS